MASEQQNIATPADAAATVPTSALPEYKQGEDKSFDHVQNPDTLKKVEVTLQAWKEKLEEMTNKALERMSAMMSENTKDAMNQSFENANKFAETTVNNIKEYYISTRVGRATVDAGK